MISEPCSTTVRADISKNRLYCFIVGKVGSADMEKLYTDIRFGIADLKPGFSVITDLTQCSLGHLGAIPTFRKVMHYIADKGATDVIRIVNKDKLLFRQALNLASRLQGYVPVYVESMQEAEALLDKRVRRSGLRFNLLDTEVVIKLGDSVLSGKIVDISKSGCSLSVSGPLPQADEEVALRFPLNCSSMVYDFEWRAKVVRVFAGGFAVMFNEENNPEKDQLWECVLHESRRDMIQDGK